MRPVPHSHAATLSLGPGAPGIAAPARVWVPWAVISFAALATSAGLVVSSGNLLVAVVPMAVLAVVWCVLVAPVRKTVLLILLATLTMNPPGESASRSYTTFVDPLANLLFKNLSYVTNIDALRLQGLHAMFLGMALLIVYRSVRGKVLDRPVETANVLSPAMWLLLGGVGYGIFRGYLRGNNMGEAVWQYHLLLFTPLVYVVFASTLRGSRDLVTLGRIVVFAACVKTVMAIAFIYFWAKPKGYEPEWATSHSDALTSAVAVAILVAPMLERPTWRALGQVLPVLAFIVWGMILNDRRIVWVSVGATFFTLILLMKDFGAFKRWVRKWLIFLLPIVALYAAVGWEVRAPIFKPVELVKSLLLGDAAVGDEKASTEYRDIENYNVYHTWFQSPVTGNGYGSAFLLVADMADISASMPNWRYHPHNQFLWTLSNLGMLGFLAFWTFALVIAYLAVRVYRLAKLRQQRTAAIACLTALIAYMNQMFGDMGLIGWYSAIYVAGAAAVVGQLAVETGAWPSRLKKPPVAAEANGALAEPRGSAS